MKTGILNIIPVLPTSDIERDIAWYKEKMGLEVYFQIVCMPFYSVKIFVCICDGTQTPKKTHYLEALLLEFMLKTFNHFLKSFCKGEL